MREPEVGVGAVQHDGQHDHGREVGSQAARVRHERTRCPAGCLQHQVRHDLGGDEPGHERREAAARAEHRDRTGPARAQREGGAGDVEAAVDAAVRESRHPDRGHGQDGGTDPAQEAVPRVPRDGVGHASMVPEVRGTALSG